MQTGGFFSQDCNLFCFCAPNDPMEDAELVARVKDGNTNAFRFLVDKYKNLVWHIVSRMVDRRDAEDLSQEIFLRVYRDIGRFRGDSKLSTWIGSIAYHGCIDHIRKRYHRQELMMEEYTPSMLAEVDIPQKVVNYDRMVLKQLVHRIIEAMPLQYRTVVTLFYLEGFCYQEITEITGMPEGTVKSYLNRGRQIIQDKMVSIIPDIRTVLFE